jgi:signal transduction histidine kinase
VSATAPQAVDPVRLEQFLDLQQDLLGSTRAPQDLPDRLAQRVALFLGVPGTALGVVREGRYTIVGAYGVPADYRARYDHLSARDSAVAPALGSGRPLVLASAQDSDGARTLFVPFRTAELDGAIQLLLPADVTFTDEHAQLARALAVLAGVALGNAGQCRRLAELARLKSDALTAMAHDLRAPLNALVGYTSLLGEGAFGPLTPEQREISATLERQAIELVDLLGATLDVARLETGQLPIRPEEFSLSELLAALRAGTFARASRDGLLSFKVPPELPRVNTDRVKVKEIVQNLVDNALKHTSNGVEVEVALAPERDTMRITVCDSGPGIADDVLPHLFEPFRPGGARPGTGFGLYLVRCFAEALGGRVAARSRAGEGTAVTVELPLVVPGR